MFPTCNQENTGFDHEKRYIGVSTIDTYLPMIPEPVLLCHFVGCFRPSSHLHSPAVCEHRFTCALAHKEPHMNTQCIQPHRVRIIVNRTMIVRTHPRAFPAQETDATKPVCVRCRKLFSASAVSEAWIRRRKSCRWTDTK